VTAGPRYLLDTNIVSDLVRHPDGSAARRLLSEGPESAVLSIVVVCEIRFGLAKSRSRQLAARLAQLLERFEILPLDAPADAHYADIRKTLEQSGTPIGPNDLLIAAHARALNVTLVTDNLREFSRVPGLRVENWLN
jgi:tRNA(fMet)-specific endonuclease VapC